MWMLLLQILTGKICFSTETERRALPVPCTECRRCRYCGRLLNASVVRAAAVIPELLLAHVFPCRSKTIAFCAPHLLVFFSSLCFLLYFCYCFLCLFCQSHAGWFSCFMVSCRGSRENKVGFSLVCASNCPKVCLGAESSSAGFLGAMLHFACSQNKPVHVLPYGK